MADHVYINGIIFTQNSDIPQASAVACEDGRIIAVGSYDDVREFISKTTRVTDLEGKYVFPGFIEDEESYLDEEDMADKGFTSVAYFTGGELDRENCTKLRLLDNPCIRRSSLKFGNCDMARDAIKQLTVIAAEVLGRNDIGVIEVGRYADFTVFEENPMKKNLRYFTNMHAEQTIVGGEIVYDAEEALMDEMYTLMTGMLV
ncbi:MAG: amidohydrolase family protein [Eubacteriaceae bacterium]|nr:amidohydrolase family protein [Eubacteriaceae bacterium]